MLSQGIKTVLDAQKDLKVVGIANNGLEAVDLAKKINPDVILMDINMPEMNGIEAAAELKKYDVNINIIMLTMLDNQKFIFDALSLGVDGYIYKDADIKELVKAIETVNAGEQYFNADVTSKMLSYVREKANSSKEDNLDKVHITPRELEIIELISQGHTSKTAAEKLFISVLTVIKHRKNIIRKLNMKNFTEVIVYAMSNKLI